MITLWRIFVASWKNVTRNAWISLATVFVFMLALLSVNVLLGVDAMIGSAATMLENKVDVTVNFKPEAPDAVVSQAQFYLSSLPNVESVNVIPPQQVLENFKVAHQGDGKILSSLNELPNNPFGAQLVLKAEHPDDYPILMQAIQNPQYETFIQSQTYEDHEAEIERVREIGREVRIIGAVLVAIFALIGLLIAFNAIRVAIYTQREEISIMWLVGASSSFIRAPFVLGVVWLALLGVAASLAVLYPAIFWLEPHLRVLFGGADPGLLHFFFALGPQIILMETVSLVALVVVMGWLAVGRYIKS